MCRNYVQANVTKCEQLLFLEATGLISNTNKTEVAETLSSRGVVQIQLPP